MTPFMQGYTAADTYTLTHFDDQNPYEPGTEEFSQWEQGWQHWVNEQFKQLQQEEEEKNPQQKLDF